MKKIIRWIASAIPHLNLILAVMMLTFFFIDRVNEHMAFINNSITKVLLAIMSFSVIAGSLLLIFYQRKEKK